MSYLRYLCFLCLFTYSGVQRILCCVLCTFCCLFVSIAIFWFLLQYSLTFIYIENNMEQQSAAWTYAGGDPGLGIIGSLKSTRCSWKQLKTLNFQVNVDTIIYNQVWKKSIVDTHSDKGSRWVQKNTHRLTKIDIHCLLNTEINHLISHTILAALSYSLLIYSHPDELVWRSLYSVCIFKDKILRF
jgi:hypothetical protein